MSMLTLDYQGNVAWVRLNRPQKKNALSFDLMRELVAVAKEIKNNRSIRAVILSSTSGDFCSGLDTADLKNTHNRFFVMWELIKPGTSLFQKAALAWRDLPIPVFASIQGFCLGGGLQLALAADFRIAHPDSQFSFMEARWGLIPDMGLTQTSQNLIQDDVLKDWVMGARIIGSDEAYHKHLISMISDKPDQKAFDWAQTLLTRSPDSLALIKKAINRRSSKRALSLEKISQLKLLLSPNSKIAIKRDKDRSISYQDRYWD